ncbi:MAG: myo-inositol 2-dehydrogenase [Bdellovibrionales bacterium RIFOXYB1_FULL_37_110]|nr:MAG: myo-inositol 2-dehydrogenase [Bdellovibrionales bacterium RIFOXYC1_FULL_37_79]OFZ58836.1 MAG: myo-inositol 2-dehydrogenase [Bdellovibrionales bacterium RIFOXYB1_FULL_37_110]OFZ64835.1 MAG: myo-inositol 2-dehydrogenase [Bdellovibrionales bacterium RIFOXYD1_FULL_36_51]
MIWIIGSGYMSIEYAKVLKNLGKDFIAIGRGEENAKKFREATGKEAIVGGLKNFLETKPNKPSEVIVASNVEQLFETTTLLLEYGVKSILLEKPGATNSEQMRKLSELAKEKSADVVLAYNRRFYSSTDKAIEIIKEDGGVTSFNFEFTEWSHTIEVLNKPKETFEAWLVANSSHVINMAFFLGGYPEKMSSYSAGEKVLKWHPRASIFAGSGVSHTNALFSYQANWSSPGRWSVEMITRKHRLIFRPMEKLQIQDIGSVAINSVEINDTIDKEFKPGLFKQTECFLSKDFSRFVNIHDQLSHINIYETILNGGTFAR